MNRSRGMEGGWGATGRSAWMGRAPLRDCRVRGKGTVSSAWGRGDRGGEVGNGFDAVVKRVRCEIGGGRGGRGRGRRRGDAGGRPRY